MNWLLLLCHSVLLVCCSGIICLCDECRKCRIEEGQDCTECMGIDRRTASKCAPMHRAVKCRLNQGQYSLYTVVGSHNINLSLKSTSLFLPIFPSSVDSSAAFLSHNQRDAMEHTQRGGQEIRSSILIPTILAVASSVET